MPDDDDDNAQSYVCDSCGETVTIGIWPYCPHGIPGGELGGFTAYFDPHITSDRDPVTGRVGVWITSRADRENLMKKNHLEYSAPGPGMPGCEW